MHKAELARKPAYVLWLLRDHAVGDWATLCQHFGWDPTACHTGHCFLEQSLDELEASGLIKRRGGFAEITVTDILARIQTALQISLKDIALRDDRHSVTVTPVFGRPHQEEYGYDVFVLMPFTNELKAVYDDHIKSVADWLSMSVARADDFFSAESIVQEVWSAIYHAKILIADCTGRNPNVFYEIGMAHTLGKPVVLITQDEHDVPFDVRHRRYIKYEYTPRGMEAFERALSETLKKMANSVPNQRMNGSGN